MPGEPPTEISGLWLRKSKSGETYMTGKAADGRVYLVFKNKKKARTGDPNDKAPDYRLMLAPPRENESR